jgi:predicted XRE-type DNA-binding protein
MRSALMQQIAKLVERKRWTQAEAASHCGISQPRVNDLLRGRIARFSLDALVNIAAALGHKVTVKLERAA